MIFLSCIFFWKFSQLSSLPLSFHSHCFPSLQCSCFLSLSSFPHYKFMFVSFLLALTFHKFLVNFSFFLLFFGILFFFSTLPTFNNLYFSLPFPSKIFHHHSHLPFLIVLLFSPQPNFFVQECEKTQKLFEACLRPKGATFYSHAKCHQVYLTLGRP